jgi:hypothetical protein
MPDLNRLISDIEKSSSEIKVKLSELFINYENLYREGNNQLRTERTASAGSMEGLEEFRRLILYVRRNKDVVASLMRGITNLKVISTFKFIEEEVEIPKPELKPKLKSKEIKSSTPNIIEVPEPIESETIEVEDN